MVELIEVPSLAPPPHRNYARIGNFSQFLEWHVLSTLANSGFVAAAARGMETVSRNKQ